MGLFKTASESLDYFAQRRGDKHVGKRFQGVETASQIRCQIQIQSPSLPYRVEVNNDTSCRYVKYFERLFLMPDLKYPPQTWMNLEEIVIYGE